MSKAFRDSGLPLEAAARFNDYKSKEKSLTVQADASQVDINYIVARLKKGGTITLPSGEPFYGDVSMFDGLQDALIKVREADEMFMQYPADLREKFDNDPVKFFDFMSDPKNIDEAVKLGLAEVKPVPAVPVPEPAKPPATPPATPPAAGGGPTQ